MGHVFKHQDDTAAWSYFNNRLWALGSFGPPMQNQAIRNGDRILRKYARTLVSATLAFLQFTQKSRDVPAAFF